MENEYYENFNTLAFATILQAIHDYELLRDLDTTELTMDDRDTISKCELEEFFNSEWCDWLLQNMSLTGKDILSYLEKE